MKGKKKIKECPGKVKRRFALLVCLILQETKKIKKEIKKDISLKGFQEIF